ncbi:MAG: hypothetical protein ABSE56_13795 [Bryobacteraceae bacterium]|jgi:hypothetical protein
MVIHPVGSGQSQAETATLVDLGGRRKIVIGEEGHETRRVVLPLAARL